MSDSIDYRAVQLGFDNDDFEKGTAESLKSIDKFKKSLDMTESAKSFSKLGESVKAIQFTDMASDLSTIANRFNALGIVAFTVIQGIASWAAEAGQKILDNLITKPLREGFAEYETLMGSVQTIMANTSAEGTTLDQVNAALQELNAYSDKTIYNFSQMARNIGTFTAAGVKLDTSVAAIKGIANLAAVSGSNAEQASTAMYQLSQALASGTVKLMDWNSVVNAGMGGKVFQNALMETARVHKVNIDAMIKQEGSFRDTLSKGWLTSTILLETLSKFTGDLTDVQLKQMGYNEEQIKQILELGKTAQDAATKVKTVTQLMSTLAEAAQSGWTQSWQIVMGDFEEAKGTLTLINNMLGEMIGASADARNKVLQAWKDAGGRTMLVASLVNGFKYLLEILKPVKEAIEFLFPPVTGEQLASLTRGLFYLVQALKPTQEGLAKIKYFFVGFLSYFAILRDFFVELGKLLLNNIGAASPVLQIIVDFLMRIAGYGIDLRQWINEDMGGMANIFKLVGERAAEAKEKALAFLQGLIDKFEKLTGFKIGDILKIFDDIKDRLKGIGSVDLTPLTGLLDRIKIRLEPLGKLWELAGKLSTFLWTLVKQVVPLFGQLASKAADGIGSFLDGMTEALQNFDPQQLFDLLNSGLLSALILAIKKFFEKGTKAFDGISSILDSVRGSLEAWQSSLKANTLLKIAAAMGILAISLVALSIIDSAKLSAALGAMTSMFVELMSSMALISTIPGGGLRGTADSLLILSGAVLILSISLAIISKLDPKQMAFGLLAIAAMMSELVGVSKLMSANQKGLVSGAFATMIFAGALIIMSKAVEIFGKMDQKTIIQGLIGIGVILTELALFMQASNIGSLGVSAGIGMIAISTAMLIMAVAVERLAAIDPAKMALALAGMAAIFVEIAGFIQLTGGSPMILSTAAGLLVISGALVVLSYAMQNMGSMSWESIAKGLVVMGGALALIYGVVALMPPNILLVAPALLVVAASLVVMAEAMQTMGGMSWDQVGVGLAVLAGSLTILSLALYAMSGALPGAAALIVAAGAIAILAPALKILGSISFEEIGRGLLALVGIFAVIGAAGYLLTPVVPTLLGLGAAMALLGIGALAVGAGMLMFSAGLAALAVSGTAGTAALMMLISSLASIMPMLTQQLGRMLLLIVDVLVAGAPTLLAGVVTMLTIVVQGLITVVPLLLDLLGVITTSLLNKVVELTPLFVAAGFALIVGLLEGIANNMGRITEAAFEIVTNFLNAVTEKLPALIQSGWDLLIAFIDGVTKSIESNMPRLEESFSKLGGALVKGLSKGLTAGIVDAVAAAMNLAQAVIKAIKKVLGINSPSKVTYGFGDYADEGLADGISENAYKVEKESTNLGDTMISSLGSALARVDEVMNSDLNLAPTITPVVDLDSMKQGIRTANGMLISPRVSSAFARGAAGELQSDVATGGQAGTSVSFVQNNYSPKALSRIELYRQTRNQLAALRGAI